MDTCPECGFTYGALPRQELIERLEGCGSAFAVRMSGDDVAIRTRPRPDVWSPLEYTCHVRDVMLMQRDRLYVALVEDEPSFKPMYREQRVVFDRYSEQDPPIVADQLAMAASLFSHAYEALTDEQWERSLRYGYPNPQVRDVEWVGHHTLHEAVHHLQDIDGILSQS
jgi:DNA segregation ATPase FtsK/SpoIIIE, S-DNA-T family